jgi:inorganic triphosphatase YgiF
MAEGLETELKLIASPAMLLRLRGHALLAGHERALSLVTRYFDTPEGALHQAGASLRLRETGAAAEQTFKSAANGNGSVRRGEWNAPVTGPAPDVEAFAPQPRELLQQLVDGQQLRPLAVTRVERTTRRLHYANSMIEAAFDFGTVEADRGSEPVCELELELIRGEAADLFALAQQLPLGPELAWSVESKGARGQAIALHLPFAAVRAADVALRPDMGVGEGFQAVAGSCLTQLLGNYRAVIETGHPDAVHQSRVAMRRLRAAFSLFARHLTDPRAQVFKAEWKAAARELAPARDVHVMIERVEAACAEAGQAAGDLLPHLRAKRDEATRAAQTMLAGEAFQHLLIGFAEWLERVPPLPDRPLRAFAADTLERRRRKLVTGKPLDRLSDEALHDLRIKGKKLRYAAEFFAALFPGKEAAKARRDFGKALARLQDGLGSVHDLAVAHEQRESLFAGLEAITAAGHSAQLADMLGRHGPGRKQLVRQAAKALGRIEHAPAWWKSPPDA